MKFNRSDQKRDKEQTHELIMLSYIFMLLLPIYSDKMQLHLKRIRT